ncbi:MAG: prepilin-type N-terminal cleavage/methylation domain-containing protein [Patescibacteria group bacterium]|jgi:prepilin-type N-terminal cleavage/methylation domain-containing protein
MYKKDERGFTLIELLIVIVIIGILAGVLITVLDPAAQQRKASEASLRANVEKGCLALHACAATSDAEDQCDTYAEAGIRPNAAGTAVAANNTPTNAVYTLTSTNPAGAVPVGGFPYSNNVAGGDPLYFVGTLPSQTAGGLPCTFYCSYNFGTDAPSVPMLTLPAAANVNCSIGVQ